MPRIIVSLAVLLCVLVSTAAFASPNIPRLRAAASSAERLLARAMRESAIVRELALEIAKSDLIVYVEIGRLESAARATTELVTVTAHSRFLRVTLPELTAPGDLIPLLAHELQHAVEIARAPSVRDTESLRAHYTRIGVDPGAHHTFETLQARAVERDARREFLRRRR